MQIKPMRLHTLIIIIAAITVIMVGNRINFGNSNDPAYYEATTLTILVPQNIDEYETAMTEYVQTGVGSDPAETIPFIKKQITVQNTVDNIVKASAEAAAAAIPPRGGPKEASVVYLKVKNGTAYVMLDIELDGWAGVSVSIVKIHPLVEKTLLEFPEINKVVFDLAPGDKRQSIVE